NGGGCSPGDRGLGGWSLAAIPRFFAAARDRRAPALARGYADGIGRRRGTMRILLRSAARLARALAWLLKAALLLAAVGVLVLGLCRACGYDCRARPPRAAGCSRGARSAGPPPTITPRRPLAAGPRWRRTRRGILNVRRAVTCRLGCFD